MGNNFKIIKMFLLIMAVFFIYACSKQGPATDNSPNMESANLNTDNVNPNTDVPNLIGSISLTSDIAGMVLIDGSETGKHIKAQGAVFIENIDIGMTEVAIRLDNGSIVKTADMVLVKAGETVTVNIPASLAELVNAVPESPKEEAPVVQPVPAAATAPVPAARAPAQPVPTPAAAATPTSAAAAAPAPTAAAIPTPAVVTVPAPAAKAPVQPVAASITPTAPPPPPRGDTSNPISLQANDAWVSQTMSLPEMWFTLRPSANGRLTVETDGNLDTKMEIYDGNSMLKQDDDGGSGLNAKIMIDASSGKNYRIKVWEYERKTGGNYRIRASLSQITVIDLTKNSESVHTINVNSSYKCRFSSTSPSYAFILEVPSEYNSVRIYSEGSRSINGMVLNSLGMALALGNNLNEAVNHVLASNTSGGNINLRVTTTTEKNLYILLTEANDNTGEFTLTVEGIR